MAGRLTDKVCVITGAASGQGRIAAEVFAWEGAQLVLGDVDVEGLAQAADLAKHAGAQAAALAGDLTREDANQALMDLAVRRYGRIDALYNAAGLVRFGPAHELSLEDWSFVIEHELTITFLGCKHALRAMQPRGAGCIINISSVSGLLGAPNHAAHAATKAGITGLTKQIAVEYGPKGIRCNAIAPGFLVYEAGERRVAGQSRVPPTDHIPLRRHATPHDTAKCAAFLASDDSSFITGQIIVVDGGASAQ